MYKNKLFMLLCCCFILLPFNNVSAKEQITEINTGDVTTEEPNQPIDSDSDQDPEPNPTPAPIPNPSPKPVLSQKKLTIVYGKKGSIPKIKRLPSSYKITYKTVNSSIVTVDKKGVLTPKNIGSCKVHITITDLSSNTEEPLTYKLIVSVNVTSNIKKISFKYLESSSISLAIKQTRKLNYSISPNSSNIPTLVWKSSNSLIASVSNDGTIKAKKIGKTTISLSVKGTKNIIASVKLTVKKRTTSNKQKKLSIVNITDQKYTYSSMETDIKQLLSKYGDRIQVTTLGTSYDNHKLYQITLGNPNAKKNIVINSSIHAREYMTSQLTMRQLEYYCSNYYTRTYKGRYYSELFNDVCIHLIPMVNPDGVSISQFGLKGVRNATFRRNVASMCKKYGKGSSYYYKRWKANVRGVDLNRNFNPGWKTSAKNYKHPSNAFYKGTAPASEKETQAIIKLINSKNPKATINYHAMGSILYWYFGQKGELLNDSKKLLSEIRTLTNYSPVNYPVTKSYDKKNATGLGDWTSIRKKVPTATIEIGKSECPVNIKEFPSIWNKNKEIWAATAGLYD